MKHLFLKSYLCLLMIMTVSTNVLLGQSLATADSVKATFNFKQAPWYIRSTPFSIYATAGKTSDRVAQNIEIGKTFRVVDVGIAFGRNSLRPDTTLFLEGRVTMDVANYGIFANEMTIGAGKVFDSKGSLMLELSYNIFAQVATNFGVGLTTGYYDFSNDSFDSSKTFYGIVFRYGLQRTDSGGIVGMGRGRRVRTGHGHR
ncbi:hypothetical protein [Spirosoma flavum]|uniref:Uncharacterized protein n=1 Tax=Spirosoma flavum TaxID=2048557 RepID=A0ABW6AFL6_9BACT